MSDQQPTIQGKRSASTYEYNIYLALIKYHWSFQYQVPLLGGRYIAGGTVVDFVVETAVKSTPLYVQGEYWHRNKERDKLIEALIMSRLGYKYHRPVYAEENDSRTPEDADRFILKTFGRGG